MVLARSSGPRQHHVWYPMSSSNKSVAASGEAFYAFHVLSPTIGEFDDDPERALILPRRCGAVFRHFSGDFYAHWAKSLIVHFR